MPGRRLSPDLRVTDYAVPLERRQNCACRRALMHLRSWIHEAVTVRKGVPAGGDIAAASSGGRTATGRLSLEGGSFAAGQAIGGWRLKVDGRLTVGS